MLSPIFQPNEMLKPMQMGIFTELSTLYSKYRPEKCMYNFTFRNTLS